MSTPRSPDFRHLTGAFDIVGDVHGCGDELRALLGQLGYRVRLEGAGAERRAIVEAPPGRRAVFVGDLVDRGPCAPDVLRIVMTMSAAGTGLCVPGNHDNKFMRWLEGRRVTHTHGLDRTVEQFTAEAESFRVAVLAYYETLPHHLWLDGGALVVAHAGIKEHMVGHTGGAIREFCLYGDNAGVDDEGLPIRYNWAADYRGSPTIVYGHTPVQAAAWLNNTVCIDTGCCFGNALTALRWPERTTVSVPARASYAERRRPLGLPPVRP